MHGRIDLSILLIACCAVFALAGPAGASPPFTAACAGNWDCIGVDDPALGDDVVVHWRAQSPTTQTIAVETRQRLGAGGTALTATTGLVTVPGDNAVHEFDARLPIVAGGVLAVSGAAGGPIQVEAVVEDDADGDGYGNRTQDACADDFNTHADPCGAVTSFGSALTWAPDPAGFSASGNPMDAVQVPSTAPRAAATKGGVITAFRLRSATTAPLALQVLRPDGAGAYAVAGVAAPATPAAGGALTTVTGVRLPVTAGDQLGLRSPGDLGAIAAGGSQIRLFDAPFPGPGETATPNATTHLFRLLAQADVEPDADGDAYGDLTQDRCPYDPSRQTACSADLLVHAAPHADPVNPGGTTTVTFFIANHGPHPATNVVLRATAPAGSTFPVHEIHSGCPGTVAGEGATAECRIARVEAGQEAEVYLAVPAQAGTTIAIPASASSDATDPDPANNTATWTAAVRPLTVSPPFAGFVVTPCRNAVRGTRDDDVLRGTAFGDRLVGSDGDDLLKGLGAGDCLEGGAGDDVLDGGDGDDRLNGSSGRDRLAGGAGADRLTGGRGNDRIGGGPGNDTIAPGAGRDVVAAGGGDDTINAVDGVGEAIDCGAGRDTVRADRRDRLAHCERVTRRR